MKRSDAFPSQYVSKDDVESPVVWTVAGVSKVEMSDDDGGKKSPPVMTFKEDHAKPLILNNTNWMVLEDLYGDDSDKWVGHPIELYKDPAVMFGGKRVGGVRVRKPQNGNGEYTIDSLKDLREKLVAAGGTKPHLTDTDISTPDKLKAQIEAHKELLVKQLAATI